MKKFTRIIALLCVELAMISTLFIPTKTHLHSKKQNKAQKEVTAFINGNVKKVPKKSLEWWSENGIYRVTNLFKYGAKEYDRFDVLIIAFNNYWIYQLKDKKKILKNEYMVDPNYIKAMIYNESTMGTHGYNGKRDIMQMFYEYDPDVHILSRNKTAYQKYIGDDNYNPNEGLKQGIKKNGFKSVKMLYNKDYKVVKKRVTSQMSVCFGVFWLYYKVQVNKDVKLGIKGYNGGGDKKYIEKIKKTLQENGKGVLVNDW